MGEKPRGADTIDEGSDGPPPEVGAPLLNTVPIRPDHRVADFTCARSPRVQSFLSKAIEREDAHYCRVFIWEAAGDPTEIIGYYTLSSAWIVRADLANAVRKEIPGQFGPMMLLGYMGRADDPSDRVLVGKGQLLIADAALRAAWMSRLGGIWGLMLSAETDGLVPWYVEQGFRSIHARPQEMYAPLDKLLPAPRKRPW